MLTFKPFIFAIAALCRLSYASETGACKCAPADSCWPSTSTWNALNTSISGQLIAVQPVAISCYSGPLFNNETCAEVNAKWDKCAWQAEQPAGLCQDAGDQMCPPVDPPAGATESCTIGNQPRYAVNATSPEHVVSGIKFAAKNNVRLVVKTTGHDLLRRSQGFGSLEIWLRYFRTGLDFQERFQSSGNCKKSKWRGSAMKIGGGYQWSDVYAKAKENNVVVVGGGAPSIGAIGGWMQGGGMGPASHHFGIGADQLLEAEVALPDGNIVTVDACRNSDIYTAIRGGGPSTYGIVLSATFKAHPMVAGAGHQLSFPFSPANRSQFLDALTALYSSFPDLMDAGYAAFGFWSLTDGSLVGSAPPGYFHNAFVLNQTLAEAQATFAPVQERLESLGIDVSVTWSSYNDYWELFNSVAGYDDPGFPIGVFYSRFFDRKALQGNITSLKKTIEIVAGEPEDATRQTIECMSGGQVFRDANDPYSGAHPTWRTSYCMHISLRDLPDDADDDLISAIKHDITNVKGSAMTALAPDTGTYMNEGGREDPNWKVNFYGSNYDRHLKTKKCYDPKSIFYCPTCVGSDEWAEDDTGRLCRVKSKV
ncbi:isoamyl alcohol oxidase [Ilyonectria sp. MPI-CAGE-AT-0026]|nr:isoamyl alcohol oxidase [Ilyonectria sp. MPI-CAGE-AT-0026]